MKKAISLFLSLVLILTLAGSAAAEEKTLRVRAEGSLFTGAAGEACFTDMRFDPLWLTEGDNTKYDPRLAAFAAMLCTDVYYREKDIARGNATRVTDAEKDPDPYDRAALAGFFGFEDVTFIESYKITNPLFDTNDSVTMLLGCLPLENATVILAAYRGCYSIGEWGSIFDIGSTDGSYASLTGEHPEWTDPSLPKGTGVAAQRARQLTDEYISAHTGDDLPVYVLYTGHSRGGILASVLGAWAEKEGKTVPFTYAFSTSGVTCDPEAREYRTVFNIYDSGDFFSSILPFGNEPLYRFGQEIAADISASAEIKNAIAGLREKDDYVRMPDDALAEFRSVFGRRFPDRNSLYGPAFLTFTYASAEEAAAGLEQLLLYSGAEGLNLGDLYVPGEVTASGDGVCSVTVRTCGAAALNALYWLLAYGNSVLEPALTLFAGDADACRLYELVSANAAAISAGHRILNTLALSQYAQ